MTTEEFIAEWHNEEDRVLVHTSGSTGEPKPMWVEKRRMEASARTTCAFLGLKPGDTALLCLPLDFIAGKMMVVRALTCGLRLISVEPSSHPLHNPSSITQHPTPNTHHPTPITFAAMVPLQVYNSLQVAEERECLRQVDHLIIGGGAIDDKLATELKSFPNAVWSTYGMTETLSHIALRRLSGSDATEWYTPFEGVHISLADDGCLVIDAPMVCADILKTNDIAEIKDGCFRILGRKDNVVCSGGVKIQIEEVERILRQQTDSPFMISKCKDQRFGEAVVLLVEKETTETIRTLCQQVLPKYWQPRYYYSVDHLPTTETGKPARKETERLISRLRDQAPSE